MKSMFRSFVAMALLACAVFAGIIHDILVVPVLAVVQGVKRFATYIVAGLMKLGARCRSLPASMTAASVKSFYLRIVRRQRPAVTPGWRMCSSA